MQPTDAACFCHAMSPVHHMAWLRMWHCVTRPLQAAMGSSCLQLGVSLVHVLSFVLHASRSNNKHYNYNATLASFCGPGSATSMAGLLCHEGWPKKPTSTPCGSSPQTHEIAVPKSKANLQLKSSKLTESISLQNRSLQQQPCHSLKHHSLHLHQLLKLQRLA